MGKDNRGTGFFTGLMLFKAGFVIGAIIGAGAAYILSQKSTREMLKAKVTGAVSRATESIREAVKEGREAAARKEAELWGDPKEEEK
jgi:gas vesicle protein